MKRLFLIAALALVVVPQASAGPWLKSLTAAQKKAKESNQLIFVDLFADWCGWCHRMEQEVFPSQAFQSATEKMVLLRLNTEDGGEGSAMARKFQVSSLPTFLLITGEGTMAGMIRGYSPAKEFSEAVKGTEAKHAAFTENVKKETTFEHDYQRRLDLALELAIRQDLAGSEMRLRKLTVEPNVPLNIRDLAYFNLAMAQTRGGRTADALKTIGAFGKVQKKGETYERARFLTGQIYYEQGKLVEAANELRRFKTAFPQSTLVGNADMLLPQIEAQLKQK